MNQTTSAQATTIQDKPKASLPGIPLIAAQLVGGLVWLAICIFIDGPLGVTLGVLGILAGAAMLPGYYSLEPNQAAVLTLFGAYVGTSTDNGLRWNNIFYSKRIVSLRVHNFESGKLKVNDLDGNPIEIAAITVWRVNDSAKATLAVSDYAEFVRLQAESAVRILAGHYAYDSHEESAPSLRDNPEELSAKLADHIQDRLREAGISVIEARISHLAYSPEIAGAMLQRQQASAVVAARAKIVAGAVGTVEMALAELQKSGAVELDEERKAAMVSNLLVVLCSDRAATPVINAGSIHG